MTDVRLAVRRLLQTPTFTAVAVVTLGLGIAANTTIFAFIDALVLRPAASRNVEDVHAVTLVSRRDQPASQRRAGQPTATIEVWRRFLTVNRVRAFAADPIDPIVAVANVTVSRATIRIPGRAARVGLEAATGGYATVFQLTPLAGRLLNDDDEIGALPNVVISERLWRDWFGGDRSVLGRVSIGLAGDFGGTSPLLPTRQLTVVGVAPRGLTELVGSSVDIWIPMSLWRQVAISRGVPPIEVIAGQLLVRTRRDAVANGIQTAVLNGLTDGAEAARRDDIDARVTPLSGLPFQRGVIIVLGLAALVLVAACANLANMVYARSIQRSGEIAIRLALGATRSAIFRLVALESALLSGAAVIVALLLSALVLRLTGVASGEVLSATSYRVRYLEPVATSLDWRGALYGLSAGAFAAVAVGFLTAMRASRVSVQHAIASGGAPAGLTGRSRMRLGLVAVQITIALLLVMGTGLYVRRAMDLFQTNVRYDTSRVTAAHIDLSLNAYNADRGRAFYRDLLSRVERIPGVETAALTDGLPGYGYVSAGLFQLTPEAKEQGKRDANRSIDGAYAGVSEAFLDTLGLTLLRGRPFRPTDRYGAPDVAVLCESAAQRLWPGEDAIGKRMMFGNDGVWRTVVGISSDPVRATSDTEWHCESCVAFVPWDQRYRPDMLVMVRSQTPQAVVEPLVAAVRAIDADIAILETAPIEDSLLAWLLPVRAAMLLIAPLGILALAIAALGVYAVVSFLVERRVREFGIRLALGATPRQVVRFVLDDAVHILLIGLLPGVFIASVAERLLGEQLRNVMPNDIPTWFAVPALIFVIGLVAAYVPARRASKTDPNVALRQN